MRRAVLTLCWWLCASAALAQAPSEQTLACVSASTLGQIERDGGRLLSARARFRSCAQPACPSVLQKSCADWLLDVERRIPSVVVRVSEHDQHDILGASVSIDGAPLTFDGRPVQLDPGTHVIAASAPGWLGSERTFLLTEREQARLLVMELERPRKVVRKPREPARFRVPVASWILGGVGVAGVASFAVLRVEAGEELKRLQDSCSPGCSRARTERGRHYALAADLSLGVGIAAIAGAGAWALGSWLWGRERAARVAWYPTRNGWAASVAVRY